MTVILWLVAALVAALGVLFAAAWLSQGRQPPIELPAGAAIPTTPLQRLARLTLGVGLGFASAAATLVASQGPQAFAESDRVRLSATALILAAVGVLGWFGIRAGIWARRDDGTLDERDQAILARAPAGQSVAILVILAAWVIALTETHRLTGLVPSIFLYLIFWSCVLVSLLALPIGVLVGYRRS